VSPEAIVPDESEGEAPLMPITNRYKPMGSTVEVDFKTTRACHATMKSHIDQVVVDNLVWESSAASGWNRATSKVEKYCSAGRRKRSG
jgi:type III restriction enzyme